MSINNQLKISLARNRELELLLSEALEEIRLLKIRIGSKNSSIPPSKDITKASRNTSLRKKSGKKSGGQKGHKGHNLKMVSKPDVIVDHKITSCNECDTDLTEVAQHIVDKQQISDIPQPTLEVTEHRQYETECPHCQTTQRSTFPFSASRSKTQYGVNIKTLVNYLNIRQSLPIRRTKELLDVLFGCKISEGSIVNMIKSQSEKLQSTYNELHKRISKSKVVGSDETGCTVEGNSHWLWVYQNLTITFLFICATRGYKAIESLFPDGLKSSVLVSDRLPAQLKTPSKGKQFCLAHIIRDCNKLVDHHNSRWAIKLKGVLVDIFALCRQSKIQSKQKEDIESRLSILFDSPLTRSNHKIVLLKNKLQAKRQFLTTCLYQRSVPPDNNASERAIRKMKIKEKISGGFRSTSGANHYATIQSIIDTAIKQGIHPFEALKHPHLVLQ